MVRLKAFCNFISELLKVISIPYGAIKSNGVFNCPNLQTVFQFLMVRLKVSFVTAQFLNLYDFNSLWCD